MSRDRDCLRADAIGLGTSPARARMAAWRRCAWAVFALCALLAMSGCGTLSGRSDGKRPEAAGKRGGYYLDDGPGDRALPHPDEIADAVPRWEPLHRGTARPYTVMGRSYTPMTRLAPYRERGLATWYGRRYHGQPTSSGELYDMYAPTAAHTVLPIPSYARVTNLANQRSVIVRINDRGPFLGERLIDLSYVAAHKLDLLRAGSALVEVEAILPETWIGHAARERSLSSAQGPAAASAQSAAAVSAQPPAQSAVVAATAQSSPSPPAPVSNDDTRLAAVPAFFLQLGAFAQRENAERHLERVRSELSGLEAPLALVSNNDQLHRVQAGPYSTRDAAVQAADAIAQRLGVVPVLVHQR